MTPRSVKAWPRHPFQDYLVGKGVDAQGRPVRRAISDLTGKLYGAAAHRLEASGKEPLDWYQDHVTDATLTRKTVGVMRTAVAHYMVWKGLVDNRAAANVMLPEPGSRNRRSRIREAMSEDETNDFIRMVKDLPDPLPVYLLLLLYTGLRSFEGCALDIDDVILTGRTPRLRVIGKGNKPREPELGHDARLLLSRYIQEEGRSQGPLFLWEYQFKSGPYTDRLKTYVVRRELQLARQRVDPSWEVSPHVLRHTMATEMHESGISLEDMRKHLGHEELNMLSRYVSSRPGQMAKALDKMPRREQDGT